MKLGAQESAFLRRMQDDHRQFRNRGPRQGWIKADRRVYRSLERKGLVEQFDPFHLTPEKKLILNASGFGHPHFHLTDAGIAWKEER